MKSDFYVKIFHLTSGNYKHEFWYKTDLRFEHDMPCVNAAAIYAWCEGHDYSDGLINF